MVFPASLTIKVTFAFGVELCFLRTLFFLAGFRFLATRFLGVRFLGVRFLGVRFLTARFFLDAFFFFGMVPPFGRPITAQTPGRNLIVRSELG